MKAVVVFIDGTICDTRDRHHLIGTPAFYAPERVLADRAVAGSVECLQQLARSYEIVYMGARPASAEPVTRQWLSAAGFPAGPAFLAPDQPGRLRLARELAQRFDFAAGIGDRWDDNELHLAIGCLSIILKQYEGNWDTVRSHLLGDRPKGNLAVRGT